MNIVITGPRPKNLGNCYKWNDKRRKNLRKVIYNQLKEYITEKLKDKKIKRVKIYIGMALGTDMDAFDSSLKLRKEFKNIKIIACVPFRDQFRMWNEDDKSRYFTFLDKANRVIYVDEDVKKYIMEESTDKKIISKKLINRNKFMVNQLIHENDILFAYVPVNVKHSGTTQCVNYALWRRKKVKITELCFNK